ncbi:uncharacterized protein C8Q71DRAFT_910160 [Rhodofomes roseus]|uniref:Uncharacterized protein n=1 Tax=Rhodofomes roseus TaxID=34475 RepID=A0ABQ8K710_9APHY|nr:uncharacterized protein C8Q71DRAFT_910160 [Rhodofomes roseus]KAH9832670.1 hypothetical protein C8Q71DRAFT_910160 [Rhodofomes roseus]
MYTAEEIQIRPPQFPDTNTMYRWASWARALVIDFYGYIANHHLAVQFHHPPAEFDIQPVLVRLSMSMYHLSGNDRVPASLRPLLANLEADLRRPAQIHPSGPSAIAAPFTRPKANIPWSVESTLFDDGPPEDWQGPVMTINGEDQYEFESITGHDVMVDGTTHYWVKWAGWPHPFLEPAANFASSPAEAAYWARVRAPF